MASSSVRYGVTVTRGQHFFAIHFISGLVCSSRGLEELAGPLAPRAISAPRRRSPISAPRLSGVDEIMPDVGLVVEHVATQLLNRGIKALKKAYNRIGTKMRGGDARLARIREATPAARAAQARSGRARR